jgi:hypothetical protein
VKYVKIGSFFTTQYNLGYALPSKGFCNQDYVTRAILLKCTMSLGEFAVPHKSASQYIMQQVK